MYMCFTIFMNVSIMILGYHVFSFNVASSISFRPTSFRLMISKKYQKLLVIIYILIEIVLLFFYTLFWYAGYKF